MVKYIDSDKLKELIDEKWKELANNDLKVGGHKWDPEINTYLSVLKLIDSLQQDQSNSNLEEKAEAYDVALNQAKFYHGNCPSESERKKLEKMFPILCESEDERIRKELLAVINDLVLPNEQKARFNAWLEKQKEEKPIDWSKEDENYYNEVCKCIEKATPDSAAEHGLLVWLENLSLSLKKRNEDVAKLCSNEWSKEDEKNISAIKIALRDAKLEAPEEFESNGVEMTVKDFENAELWFKSIHSSWKPSEQEKLALETAICILTEINCPKTVANLQAILDAFDDKESHPF